MKIEQFSDKIPGKLVSIQVREIDKLVDENAFVPDPLPPAWEVPGYIWQKIVEARSLIGVLEGIGRNLPNPTILLRPLVDREAIQSSRLEGTYATPKELLLFEFEKSESPERDEAREVFNYREALDHGVNSDLPLSLRLLKQMHQILLTNTRGKNKTPGEFRRLQVAIGTSRRFVPPPPNVLANCLNEMEHYMHESDAGFDPLIDCFLVHYQFETIHPFNDGNGRVGRLLLALMMQEKCDMTKPWLYLSEFFEKHRDEYISHLFEVSTKNDWESWIEFCLDATIAQAKETIVRCEKLLDIREKFSERLSSIEGSVRLSQIVEGVFDTPFVRVAELARRLGVTYPTAKKDVEKLATVEILREVPGVSPITYYAPEIFGIAYETLTDEEL